MFNKNNHLAKYHSNYEHCRNQSKYSLVLDIGCGSSPKGDVNIDLYPNDRSQCAFHWNPKEVNNFLLADGKNSPFKDNVFHKVHSSHVIEHIESPLTFLKECKRISKGVVVLYTPSEFDIGKTLTHIYTWNPHTLKMLMKKVFDKVECNYIVDKSWLKKGRKIVDWFPFIPAIFSKMGIHKEVYGIGWSNINGINK